MKVNSVKRWQLIMPISVLLALMGLIWPAVVLGQSVPSSLSQVPSNLPPRPTPVNLPARPDAHEPFKGAHLELHVAPAADIWTEVEWLDGKGQWHVVEGWRGYATPQGIVRWYVAERDLKKGPFRWQIYLYEDGDYLASSVPFNLPADNDAHVIITVAAPTLAAYLD